MKQNAPKISILRSPGWLAAFAVALGIAVSSPIGGSALAETIAGRISMADFNGAEVCLGLMGEPSADAEATTVACGAAPTWSIWEPTQGQFRIAYGPDGSSAQFCLDVDTAHPSNAEKVGLWYCRGSTSLNQMWSWPTPSGRQTPEGVITLVSQTKCVAPVPQGEQVVATACNPQTQVWTLRAPLPAPIQAGYQEFTAIGTFTAPKAATYRVLAIGGGGGGSYDEGSGGGSGYVAYQTVALAAGDTVDVVVGAGGAGGTTPAAVGGNGQPTTFGTHLAADGGQSGQGSNGPGGNGGSGGAGDPDTSRASQTGGTDGSGGTGSGAGAGTGQGAAAFSGNFANIVSLTLSAAPGGTTATANGSGGGGGGGLGPAGDTSTGAASNGAGTANGGKGYGAGGAGGNGSGGVARRSGTDGVGGYLIVEWD